MKRLMWVGLGILGVLLVGLGATYIYFRHDNYAALRELLREQAYAALGSDLALDGPVDVEVGEDTRIMLRNITLSNPDPKFLRSVIAIDEARISVATKDAVGQDYSGASIDLYGVRVAIERSPEGRGLPPAPANMSEIAQPKDLDLPEFDHIRAHDLSVEIKGLLGSAARKLDFDMVALEKIKAGGFKAQIAGTPRGLDTRIDIEAKPLDPDTPALGASWSARVKFGQSDLAALFELRTGRRIFARVAVDSQLIVMEDLIQLFSPYEGTAAAEMPPLIGLDDALPVGWLRVLDAGLDVNLSELRWAEATAKKVHLAGRLERGWFLLSPVSVALGEGGITGLVRFDATTSPVSLDLSAEMKNASLAMLGESLGAAQDWRGNANGAVKASGHGDTLRQLLSLEGVANFIVTHAVVDPAIHHIVGHDGFAPLFDREKETFVPCLALEGRLEQGGLALAGATLVTDYGRMAASGVLAPLADKIDLNFISAPDQGAGRFKTRRSHLSGSFENARWDEEVLDRRWLSLARPAAACVVDAVAPR